MTIQEIATQKVLQYDQEYLDWRKANPGKIMHGAAMKSVAANLAQHCHTPEELQALINVYQRKAAAMQDVHGFNFWVDAFMEIQVAYEDAQARDLQAQLTLNFDDHGKEQ
jgi:hypothetical protein